MTTKELLQQALDALLPHSSSHGNSWRAVEDAAIDALKQAIAQEQEPLFKVLIDKHPGLADELASQSANTNHVVSQKPAETADKLVRRCETCNHILNATKPYGECFSCEDFSNWEPKP